MCLLRLTFGRLRLARTLPLLWFNLRRAVRVASGFKPRCSQTIGKENSDWCPLAVKSQYSASSRTRPLPLRYERMPSSKTASIKACVPVYSPCRDSCDARCSRSTISVKAREFRPTECDIVPNVSPSCALSHSRSCLNRSRRSVPIGFGWSQTPFSLALQSP